MVGIRTEVAKATSESEEDVRLVIREKNLMGFAVFWHISVRLCGFRTPFTPPLCK